MSVAIIGVAGTVAAAGISAYSSYSANKSADARQKAAMGAQGGGKGFQPFQLPPAPAFMPQNVKDLAKQALRSDTSGYQISDSDFAKRHPGMLSAEKLFEAQTLKDQTGDTELMPQVQNEFLRSGLAGSLNAFGDTGETLAPGSAGEAGVARNLGISILGFQDRNRANREHSLALGESLFPRRQFGLTGADTASILMANNSGQNNFNQANYAAQVAAAQQNYLGNAQFQNAQTAQGNVNSQADATRKAAQGQMISGIASSAIGGLSSLAGTYAGSSTPQVGSINRYGGTYEGSMGGRPVYRPALAA